MTHNMFRKTLVTIFALLLSVSGQASHVKCKCPQVDARGTGDSSCSASETGGRCSIAFNEFDPAYEAAAIDVLKELISWKDIQLKPTGLNETFTQQKAIRLIRNPEQLMDQILVYSLVSLAERGDVKNYGDQIVEAHKLMSKHAAQISNSFVSGRQKINDSGLSVTHGCLAYRTGEFWIMYKAIWSESIEREQC